MAKTDQTIESVYKKQYNNSNKYFSNINTPIKKNKKCIYKVTQKVCRKLIF
ncbi:hypothetical protein CHREV_208 [Choristoneura rosaceana entomopoxvirus 'L']|uniref:N1R/p28-like protein n=1 Tax=Choristoneura rosaceana entomopoxvirus 'L' TaxID=1293539 RepID=A0ABM9QKQ0_9POXV|nr:hypothetical protein CHREV_208 [Choristoneura rosaceana entomopoxvirus 'L']CCU56110.1 hypothetical protein CHREV_208 [Choristoneura rosaceana entomopoxvirus 'L']